jgi:hypothetical protein
MKIKVVVKKEWVTELQKFNVKIFIYLPIDSEGELIEDLRNNKVKILGQYYLTSYVGKIEDGFRVLEGSYLLDDSNDDYKNYIFESINKLRDVYLNNKEKQLENKILEFEFDILNDSYERLT